MNKKINVNKNALLLLFLLIFFIVLSASLISATEITNDTDTNNHTQPITTDNITNNAIENKSTHENSNIISDNNTQYLKKSENSYNNLTSTNLIDTSISANNVNMKYHDGSKLIVYIKSDKTVEGKYIRITIGNDTYWRPIQNNKAELTIYNKEGTYIANCIFNYYGFKISKCSAKIKITDNKTDTIMTADNVIMDYKDGSSYFVKLTDKQGNPIINSYIKIIIANKTYYKITDEEGIASLPITNGAGTYTATAYYNGNYNYKPSKISSKITIKKLKTTIKANNIIKLYNNKTNFIAIITDTNGNPINNTYLITTINNRNYYSKSNEKGEIFVNINLKPGKYTAIVNFNGTKGYEKSSKKSTITVIGFKTLIVSNNFVKYYRNGTNLEGILYEINPITGNKTPLTNATVTITLKNTKYYKTTNSKGIFNLPINLIPGKYTFLISYKGYNGFSSSNKTVNIQVINHQTQIEINNLVKYYRNASNLKGRIITLDNKIKTPLKGAYLTLIFNNKTKYNIKSDNNGYFNLNINFNPGKYNAKISYQRTGYNKINKIISVTILKYSTKIICNNLNKVYNDNNNIKGQLLLMDTITKKDTPFINTYLTITLNKKNYNVKTDNNGKFNLSVKQKQGKYKVFINYKGNNGYKNINKTIILTIYPYNTKIDIKNLNKYYRNNSQLEGNLILINPLTKKETPYKNTYLNIILNHTTYNVKTDNNGHFKLNINLKPGSYKFLAQYKSHNGYKEYKKYVLVNVLNIKTKLITNNLVKYYNNGKQLSIKLINQYNQPITGAYINFKINNKTYNKITDNNGIANILIKMNTGKYDVIITYKGSTGFSSSKTISHLTINKLPITISSLGADLHQNESYKVKVLDFNGKIVSNANIIFKIRNKTYYKYTDSKGIATIPLNLKKGNYNVVVTAENNYKCDNFIETISVVWFKY